MNETSKIGRRPPAVVTSIMRLIPNHLKSTRCYELVRTGLLKSTARTPPALMTLEEKAFAELKLADDIDWFEECFRDPVNVA